LIAYVVLAVVQRGQRPVSLNRMVCINLQDSAVLRRIPQAHFVGLPDVTARSVYLAHVLRSVPIEKEFNVHEIASQTEGYSPSDLRQLLQTAAMSGPMRESNVPPDSHSRPLSTSDVLNAVKFVKPTPLSSAYRMAMANFAKGASSHIPVLADGKWQTGWGNFYDIGTLEVDHDTLDAITDLMQDIDDASDEAGEDDSE
jgi:AAA+ lid domain